jgi:hypothetical protein
VLDAWPFVPFAGERSFTTILNWESYPAREYEGRRYGMKAHSFLPYMDLPAKTTQPLEMAVGSNSAPLEELSQNGWMIRNPLPITRDLWTYQRYIQCSLAEFTVAKQGYVVSNSGWFSDRSAAYLASGRPVLTEETGFSEWLPTGEGLLSFSSPEEALDGIEAICSRPDFHGKVAREIAAAYFDSDRVLAELLDKCAP